MSEQTIIVQVEPAPANPENVQAYLDIFWSFVAIVVALTCSFPAVGQLYNFRNYSNSRLILFSNKIPIFAPKQSH